MSHNITIEGGTSVRLPTAGKYCDRDIVITATGSGGGGDNVARSIVDKTITAYSDNEVETIRAYIFYNSTSLVSVNAPSVTDIDTYAFSGCTALASVNLVGAKTIGSYAFNKCTALTSFNGENTTSLSSYAFTGCSALTEVNLPKVTSVGQYAFNGTAIKHLSLPSYKTMTTGAFRGSTFETCDFPIVTNISNNGFRAQGYIKSVTFPKVTLTASEAMRNCTALTYVDLPLCTSFGTYTFYDCSSLETLILRAGSVCKMGNVNVLTNTKIAAGTGFVYVPKSLESTYKSATNWSTYAAQIRAIEDYPEITGG